MFHTGNLIGSITEGIFWFINGTLWIENKIIVEAYL